MTHLKWGHMEVYLDPAGLASWRGGGRLKVKSERKEIKSGMMLITCDNEGRLNYNRIFLLSLIIIKHICLQVHASEFSKKQCSHGNMSCKLDSDDLWSLQ